MDRVDRVATPQKILAQEVLAQGTPVRCRPRQVIFSQDERAEKVFYLQCGLAELSFINEEGRRKTIGYVREGNFVGDAGFITQKCYGITVMAVTICQVVVFIQPVFARLFREDASFAEVVLHSFAEKLQFTGKQVYNLAFEDGMGKVASALLYFSEHGGQFTLRDGMVVKLWITQQEVAELAGVSRVTVSVVLNELEIEKIIARGCKQIVIKDTDGLRRYAM